ncbi:peptidoglycan/LPS O-acetylase OafA/YrhL [Rhizobium sp. ERR 1071]|uniref:acyltransferase family protein n=1 Tax=Rhizobium sp. ERR 1071 TaxID=2572677 RepID=UPI001198E50C|nr:acyltransferase [Rhizobium sp. ERR1071]TWB19533.1 peptidoglycan/LPS O-acetylase OafA/YrhL [Rhizobium sp. ERR1071]
MGKNRDIQALRGIAVLMVFLQHYRSRLPTPEWYHGIFSYAGFWGGVDLFFVISGFVIARSLINRGDWGPGRKLSRSSLKDFFVRRFNRLAPAAWFWIAFSTILSLSTVSMSYAGTLGTAIISAATALTATSNLYWSSCIVAHKVGTACMNPDFNGVFWSLSLEEQFYFLFAILSFFFAYWRLSRIFLIFLLFSISANYFLIDGAFSLAWALRPQGLIIGVLLAIHHDRVGVLIAQLSKSIRILICVLAITLICVLSAQMDLKWSVPILAIASATAVSVSLPDRGISEGRIGSLLQWVGNRSYSLYLCHLPIIIVVREVSFRVAGERSVSSQSSVVFAIAFAATLAAALFAAHISYKHIENNQRIKIGRTSRPATA